MYCALFSLCAQAQAPHLFSCVEGWQLLLSDYPVSSQVQLLHMHLLIADIFTSDFLAIHNSK